MNSFSKALTNIRRTPYQALAAIMVLTTTFFITALIAMVMAGLYQALVYFESRPQILVFFRTDAQSTQIDALKTELEDIPEVTDLEYIAQEDALKIYRELNQNDPLLLELVTADILPASLEVSTSSLESLEPVAQIASKAEGVDEVVLRTDLVDLLDKWLTGIKYAGVVFVGILLVTSVLIVVVVVGMKISGRNYEIKVLRLIGASRWYIQGPFLFEGAVYGIVSSILGFVLALTALLYATPSILQFAGEVPLLPQGSASLALILGVVSSLGLIVGTIGSFIAGKRFLQL